MTRARLAIRLTLPIAITGVVCAIAIFLGFNAALDHQQLSLLQDRITGLDAGLERQAGAGGGPDAIARALPLLATALGEATVTLLDENGSRVVASTRPEWIGRSLQDLASFGATAAPGGGLVRHGDDLDHFAVIRAGGESPRYTLWLRLPRRAAGAALGKGSLPAIALLALCLLAMILLTLRVAKKDVMQPLAALERYAAGEDADGEAPDLRGDEFGDLARTIKRLLRDRLYQQKREAENAKQLAKAHEFTRHIIDQAPDAVLTCDAEGNIDSFNPAAEEIFGIESSIAITMQLAVLLPALRLPLLPGRAQDAGEATVRLRDGRTRAIAFSVSEVRWGDVVRYTIMVRDVTDEKRVESALRESERRLRQLIATANEGIITLDADLRATECNPRLAEILGAEPAAIVGQDFAGFVAERYRPGLKSALAACLSGRPLREREAELKSRRGDSVWTLVSATAVGGGDDPLRLYLMVTDISALKATQVELIDSRRQLELAVSTGDVGIWGYYAGTERLEFDESYMRLVGWSTEAALPETLEAWAESLHPGDRAGVLAALRDHIAGASGEYGAEFRYQTAGRGYRWFRARGRLVAHGGESVGAHVVGIQQDVTEEKALTENLARARDEALAAAKAKAEFLANMSHELRTPLNGVLGMLSLVNTEQMSAEQRSYVEVATRSARNLLQLINNILDFSKMEARKVEVENIEFDLRMLAEDVTELLAEPAHQKNLDIALLFGAGVPGWVCGDPGRVRQILVNLIGNSIKFTTEGEIVLEIRRGQVIPEALRFEIRDTGVGIDAEQQRHIFEAFKQGDGSTTRRFGGTGLGLSITRELVTLMGGVIGVESAPGAGSTFWFEIMLPAGQEAAPPGVPPPVLEGRRVLVHDLSPTTRTALRRQLEAWGVEVDVLVSLDDLPQAMREAAAEARPYYAAVLDAFAEPEKLARIVRALQAEPALTATRIIVTTLFGRPGDAGQLRKAGVHAYLTKPVRADQLARTFAALLNGAGGSTLITRHSLAETAAPQELSVLVVDDVSANLKIASAMLAKLGARTDIALSGGEALFALGSKHYDLVFMDCQMPGMDGFATTEQLRRYCAPSHGPVVVAMTAHDSAADRARCLAAGMDDFITKPVTLDTLSGLLEKWAGAMETGSSLRDGAIDGAKSAELLDLLGVNGYRELVERFSTDARATVGRMREAGAARRGDELAAAAHAMRGTSINIGARRLGELCAALEAVLRQGGDDDVPMLVERIADTLESTLAELRAGDRIAA